MHCWVEICRGLTCIAHRGPSSIERCRNGALAAKWICIGRAALLHGCFGPKCGSGQIGRSGGGELTPRRASTLAWPKRPDADQTCSNTCCNCREEATDCAQRMSEWARPYSGRGMRRAVCGTIVTDSLVRLQDRPSLHFRGGPGGAGIWDRTVHCSTARGEFASGDSPAVAGASVSACSTSCDSAISPQTVAAENASRNAATYDNEHMPFSLIREQLECKAPERGVPSHF